MSIEILAAIFIVMTTLVIILIVLTSKKGANKEDASLQIKQLERIIALQNQQIVDQINSGKIESSNKIDSLLTMLDKKLTSNSEVSNTSFKNVADSLDKKISYQNEESNKNIKEVIERVTKLDMAQQQIIGINDSINSLEKILNDKKARGTFGEIRLHQIFISIFGENNNEIYEEQYQLPNDKRVDFMFHAPEPIGDLAIDSKFPLENFNNLINADDDKKLDEYRKLFKKDIKKHIDDISSKYIIEGVTSNQAMMFIPSESIFAEINAYHEDLIHYSYEKKVWITSPTTLMAILNLLMVVLKDLKRSEYSKQIHEALLTLKEEFDRYDTRWNNLNKHMDTVNKDLKEITSTSKKISKRFEDIEKVDID